MLPKKIPRKVKNDNYRALALYVADAKIGKTVGEKTLHAWTVGCQADDYLGGMIEVEATQSLNTRSGREKTYHLVISFRPSDERKLSLENYHEIEKEVAEALGFTDHQRHCGIHRNTDNIHMHIAYNMVHPITFNHRSPFRDFSKLHSVCRKLEKKYGLTADKGIEPGAKKDEDKILTNVKAQTVEAHSGQESFCGYVARQKPKIMAAMEAAKTWDEFHRATLALGIQVEARGAGLAFKDSYGKHRAVPSKVDRKLAKDTLEEKFGPFQAASPDFIKAVGASETYTAIPLHRGPDRDNLYEEFQAEISARKVALEGIKAEEGEAFRAIRQRWNDRRKIVEKYPMLYAHRQQLLLEMKIKEQEEIVANRAELAAKRQNIREAIPYTSWAKCLQYKAAQGNETALAILRSKKVEVAPESSPSSLNSPQKTFDEITLESLTRQQKILTQTQLNSTQRKALLSVEKMQTVLEKESLIGGTVAALKNFRIDTKGVVLFSFDNGKSIRDTGKEIHFTPNDENIRKLALEFSLQKWGKRFTVKNDMTVFDGSPKRKNISR